MAGPFAGERTARRLIINIDDFGMCDSTVRAAKEVLDIGNARSTTVMLPCPWAPAAVAAVDRVANVDVGVHLTLFSEFLAYRWGPISEGVDSLVDETGIYFYTEKEMDEFVARASVSEVEREFRSQIEKARLLGMRPTHIDGHCHGHERREDIFRMTLDLAREERLPVRIATETHRTIAREMGVPVIDHDTLDSMRIPAEAKPGRYRELLDNLPPGVSEWAIHPAVETEEIKRIDPIDWRRRVADYLFFRSPEFSRLLERENIELTRYSVCAKDWR